MAEPIEIQTGSGNIFEDLELENPDELLAKAELARKISGTTSLPKRSLEEIMDFMGNYAQSQGLTSEILESILNDERA
ncbi:MAG: hypothetical protein WBA99_00355 [Nodosilinea sp.]